MNYVIHCMGMPFNGDTIKTRSIGGSESAAYYIARELANRGHKVKVFTNSKEEGEFDGVHYVWCGEQSSYCPLGTRFAHFACNTQHDVLIIQRHPMAFHKDYASKVNILQLHDLALKRYAGAIHAGGSRMDLVTGVSQFHVDQIKKVYGFPDRTLAVVPNGVDQALYADQPGEFNPEHPLAVATAEGKFRMLYQSRPERGLIHLLRPGGIMEQLAAVGSSAHLFYCGYDNTTEQMAEFYAQLNAWGDALPNVTNLGALTKSELAGVQLAVDLLCYTTEFEEVSCITAMEAMAAGLPFLSSAHGALPETCAGSGSVLVPLKDGQADESAFVLQIQALEIDGKYREELRQKQTEAAETRTWEHAVDALESQVAEVFKRRSESPARMARHLIDHSDISALDEYDAMRTSAQNDSEGDAIVQSAVIGERSSMYAFTSSPEATAEHYRHWEGLNCDRMDANGLTPQAEHDQLVVSTRYRGIKMYLARAIAEKLAAGQRPRMLEFGCAHGHITNALAAEFPGADFVGMDFMQRSVDLATARAEEVGLKNVAFYAGSTPELAALGEFDAIVAAEVVEHVWDYRDALERLLAPVVAGGSLILTTPVGRWEWYGRENWQKGRQHLHHFELADLHELFADFHHDIVHAPAGVDCSGGPVGSWVTSITKSAGALGEIDYARKLSQQAPRDTVSLCMIVRDAEETLWQAVRSVGNFVDEVVLALDKSTKDGTRSVIEKLQSVYPNTPFKVLDADSPLEIGFDAARNATIEASCGDWILWLDADEEVYGAHNLIRLLRPGAFDGYAIGQHHMSQSPPERITTDYPTRLFRRDSGARFYGVVHEHPETTMGKAIPHTTQIGDVWIMHYGYVDEPTRKKRLMRNFPLLMRDLEKYPQRTLNKFLYIRDLAQLLSAEGDATGVVSEEMQRKARIAVTLFSELIDTCPMLRMILDGIQYYSVAVAALGSGFNAKVSVTTSKPELAGTSAVAEFDGMFDSIDVYKRLTARIAKETSNGYEDKYI